MSFDDRETFMRCKAKNANHLRVEFQHNRVHRDDRPKVRNPLVPFLVAGAVHQPMAVVRAGRDPAEDVGDLRDKDQPSFPQPSDTAVTSDRNHSASSAVKHRLIRVLLA
jgi:hypothetical protein